MVECKECRHFNEATDAKWCGWCDLQLPPWLEEKLDLANNPRFVRVDHTCDFGVAC